MSIKPGPWALLNKHDIGRGPTIPLKLSRPYFRLIIGAMQGMQGEARQGRKEVRVGVRAGPMLSTNLLTIHCNTCYTCGTQTQTQTQTQDGSQVWDHA